MDPHSFKVNTRGFNSPTARAVLVLQDGREVAIPWLGLTQWSALSLPPEDFKRIEFVRGPASALYGANAYMGVINLITPEAREVIGTKVSLVGGELETGRFDVRQAGVIASGNGAYRVNVGYARSGTWSRSRTRLDGGDFIEEYSAATDSVLKRAAEIAPLNGQSRDSLTGVASGDPKDLTSTYASARIDWYRSGGTLALIESGIGRVQNSVDVVGSGRVQVIDDLRPWARVKWSAARYEVNAWYQGRKTREPQVLLGTGGRQEDATSLFQVDAQYRAPWPNARGRIVTGVSLRDESSDSKGTLFDAEADGRHYGSFGAYVQSEYSLFPRLHAIGALRWDRSDLFDSRFTPRLALLYRFHDSHALRATWNQAFQPPTHASFFVRLLNARQNLSPIEARLRASGLGPALSGVPVGTLFTTSSAVPQYSRGNRNLTSERVNSFEIGYKGEFGPRFFVTIDAYRTRKSNFVTGLVPATAVNSEFKPWTPPDAVPVAARQAVVDAVRTALSTTALDFLALTRVEDGSTAVVFSPGNAGVVVDGGVELGINLWPTNTIQVNGSYAYYDFQIEQPSLGNVLVPNTPRHKGTASVRYSGLERTELQGTVRFVDHYRWIAAQWNGMIPRNVSMDLNASYQLSSQLRLQGVAANILDQRHYEVYGGAVIGRRILAGVTATF